VNKENKLIGSANQNPQSFIFCSFPGRLQPRFISASNFAEKKHMILAKKKSPKITHTNNRGGAIGTRSRDKK
jgi:hypothetical protein